MACVGLAYYAGLVCDAWPFLQLQLQRPPPLSAHASPPPHPVPDHTIGGGGWERQTPDHILDLLWFSGLGFKGGFVSVPSPGSDRQQTRLPGRVLLSERPISQS